MELTELSITNCSPSFNETDYIVFFRPFGPESEFINTTKPAELAFRISDPDSLFIFLVEGVGILLLACLGIVGNILSAMVLTKMKTSVGCFLLFLTISDMLVLISSGALFGIPAVMGYVSPLQAVQAYARVGFMLPCLLVLGLMAQTGSAYFTVAVTIERFLVVRYPLVAKVALNWKKSFYLSLGVVAFSVVYNFSRLFEFSYKEVYDSETNSTFLGYLVVSSPLRVNELYEIAYVYISYLLVQYVIPIGVLMVLNFSIYLRVRKANSERLKMTGNVIHRKKANDKETNLTYMLLSVVGLYLFCSLVPILYATYQSIAGTKHITSEAEACMVLLVTANSSVNFIIYCAFGQRFRSVFYDTFICYCCCPKKAETNRNWRHSETSDCNKRVSTLSNVTIVMQEYS